MTKIYGMLVAAFVAMAATVSATPAQAEIMIDVNALQQSTMQQASFAGLNWHVGDKASYKISGGIIKGKSDQFVREDTGTGFWMQQDLDMGFMGKQKIEILINKSTGQIEKMLVNGKEQQIPDTSDVEIVETKEDHIRVTAGEFDCIYVKVKTKNDGKTQEAWINPQAVPMGGQLKAVADTPIGKITQELTSFAFGQQ